MHIVAFIVFSFLVGWAIVYSDHRVSFKEMLTEPENIFGGLVFGAIMILILYGMFRAVFWP